MTRFRILLVEDNPDHAELICDLLEAQTQKPLVIHHDTGVAALEHLRSLPIHGREHPNLILMDLNLPGMSGLDLVRVIKSEPEVRRIPVVILSTSTRLQDMHDAMQAHANSYSIKPQNYHRLESLIGDIGKYWMNVHAYQNEHDPRPPGGGTAWDLAD